MTIRHYADAVVLAYVDDALDQSEREGFARHLTTCGDCQLHHKEIVTWCDILTDPSTWELALSAPAMPPEFREHRESEPQISSRVLANALRLQPPEAWPGLLRTYRPTESLIRHLLAETRRRHDSAPEAALVLIETASGKCQELAIPAFALRGDIAKERANALRRLGRLRDALEALDEADRAYLQLPISDYDRAFVHWSRGTVYFEMKRFAEARSELLLAKSTFTAYGDQLALAQVGILQAGTLFDEGLIADARQAFEELLPVIEQAGDEVSLARTYANLCTCELRLGMWAEAIDHGRTGITRLLAHGMTMEANRLQWSVGEALLLRGNDDGLELLVAAAECFDSAGMTLDAAAVRVDMSEALLRRGEWQKARDLSAHALRHFRREGADVDAAHAVSYLHRAVERMQATPELARYVREHIGRLAEGESVPFSPPIDGNVQ